MRSTHSIYVGHDQLSTLAPRLYRLWQHMPGTFWLDSAYTSHGLGRYSFLGTDPSLRLDTVGGTTSVVTDGRRQTFHDDPFIVLSRVAAPFLAQPAPIDTVPFGGGLVGYISYDLGQKRAGITGSRHRNKGAAEPLPLQSFGYYDAVVGLDHRTGYVHLVATGLSAHGEPKQDSIRPRLQWLKDAVAAALALDYTPPPLPVPSSGWRRWAGSQQSPLHSNFTRRQYVETVQHILDDIAAGTLEQVNIAQRFTVPFVGHPVDLYERLRQATPAPYGALLSHGSYCILSSSPECFVKIKDDLIEMRPIKGTRPRGHDATTDAALRQQLLTSSKDEAEHAMIVALQLEELAALCQPSTVHVAEHMVCEQYATVFHLVSTLRGRLAPGTDKMTAVAALFPGGSITGTPKQEAMEAIARYEPVPRGIYTGSVGYIGIGGNIDFSVAIRTLVTQGQQAHFHVGGAIVSQSSPQDEYEETLDKAEGMVQALFAAGT